MKPKLLFEKITRLLYGDNFDLRQEVLKAETGKTPIGDLPGGPDPMLPMQGMRIQSLTREQASHMPCGVAKKLNNKEKNTG